LKSALKKIQGNLFGHDCCKIINKKKLQHNLLQKKYFIKFATGTNSQDMKKNETARTLLGLKQEEMAALLGISRGLWSMYESGKRDLPGQAQIRLAEILKYVESAKANAKITADKDAEGAELNALLKENEYQQLRTARQLAAAERTFESGIRALQLAAYLISQTGAKKEASGLSKVIETRAKKHIEQNGTPALTRLKIKQTTLEQEEILIRKALGL
jgi:transcriptional regulator with XRE-family HTH domain